MRKKRQYHEIKHFNAKFLCTLLIGMISGATPIMFIGGDAIILAIATGIAGASFGLFIFGLVNEGTI